ncbi:MAG: hypothetical protein ACR2PC_16045 [Tsuneonella suprasediminis]
MDIRISGRKNGLEALKGWIGADSTTLDIRRVAQAAAAALKPSEYIPITIELAGTLRVERERTGYGAPALLRRFHHSRPEKLEPGHINGWINLQSKRGRRVQIEWVLSRYAELPDAGA